MVYLPDQKGANRTSSLLIHVQYDIDLFSYFKNILGLLKMYLYIKWALNLPIREPFKLNDVHLQILVINKDA